ncbi:MAG: GDSL-type esterase/lipase family protein [Limisphaerales bacterium]
MNPAPQTAVHRNHAAWTRLARALVLACLVFPLAGALAASSQSPAPLADAKRIVVLGDSITYGGGYVEYFETWLRLTAPRSRVEILNLGLPSETVSGLSEDGHAGGAFPRPDLHERLARVLTATQPDVVIACYGMNDGIYFPFAEARAARFQDGIRRLREAVLANDSHTRIIHLTSAPFDPQPLAGRTLPAGLTAYPKPYVGYDDVLTRYSDWLLTQRASGWEVVDVHGPLARFLAERRRTDPEFHLAGDGVHPTPLGHWLIARELLRHLGAAEDVTGAANPEAWLGEVPRGAEVLALVQRRQRVLKDAWLTRAGHRRPGMNTGKPFPEAQREAAEIGARLGDLLSTIPEEPRFPGKRSEWFGFPRFDFEIAGRPVLVVAPRTPAPGRPWLWHGEFFGHKPKPDIALLERGFHVVYTSIPDHLGGPEAVAHWNRVHQHLMSEFGFSARPGLVGLSRGGLYCYNWATANPTRVACIYGDAPVCDFKSWPGGKGKGPGSARDWELVLQRYGFKSEAEALAYAGNPVDSLAPLAAARVPILHVYGDADEVVPWDENTGVLAERYRQLGGSITLIAKPGVKHHPHGLEDPTPIVEFLWTHAAGDDARTWFQQRPGHTANNQDARP